MKLYLCAILGAALAMTGCGKKEETPAAEAEPQTSDNSSGNPLTAPVDYLGAVNKAQKNAKGVVAITSVQQAVQLFNANEGRYPKDLQELVTEKYLPSLPTPPSGRIVYDPQTGTVNLGR